VRAARLKGLGDVLPPRRNDSDSDTPGGSDSDVKKASGALCETLQVNSYLVLHCLNNPVASASSVTRASGAMCLFDQPFAGIAGTAVALKWTLCAKSSGL